MKKFFTLLFVTAMLSTAFAQNGQKGQKDQKDRNNDKDDYAYNDNHDYGKSGKWGPGSYVFTPRERDMEIAQINREYDYKIRSVKNQFYMSWFQKNRQIRFLEKQRDNEIHAVTQKFNDRKNKFGDFNRSKKDRW